MTCNNIDFITYCIGNLSRLLNMSAVEFYRRLKQSGILNGYIIPNYDVLHTFSKEYLMEDLIEYMREPTLQFTAIASPRRRPCRSSLPKRQVSGRRDLA